MTKQELNLLSAIDKICALDFTSQLGIFRILGVSIYKDESNVKDYVRNLYDYYKMDEKPEQKPQPFSKDMVKDKEELLIDIAQAINSMNRNKRRNFDRILNKASKKK